MRKAKRHNAPPSQALTLADIPERRRLRELSQLLEQRRDQIAEIDLEIETVREQLAQFENAYQTRLFAENAELARIEQMVRHCERWADLLRDASAAGIVTQAKRLEQRRNRELAQAQAAALGDGSTAVDEQSTDDTASAVRSPNERLKTAYRALARRYHPDLATTEDDRMRCGEMMARINALYHMGDLERLEALAEQAKGGAVDEPDLEVAEQVALLEKRLQWFDLVIANLQDERAQLERTPTCELWRNVAQATLTGRDLMLEIKTEMRQRVEKSYAQVACATHELESEVESFNRRNAGDGTISKRQGEALERRFDPFADKRLIRLGLAELRDLQVRPEAHSLAEQLEAQVAPERGSLRLLLLTYVAELSPFPLPGLESYDDISVRFAYLGQNDGADETVTLEKALVLTSHLIEYGVKRATAKVAHLGLRFRSDLVREAVPILLRALPIRREFKRVLGVLGDREDCPACRRNIFAVPLFRTHGLDDLRALVCPACGHTLRSYWMPKGKDVQAVLNAAFLDFELVSEWSFQLGRGSFGAQLLPLQVDTIKVGELRERIYNDLFKRYEIDIPREQITLTQGDTNVADDQAVAELTLRSFVIRFAPDAELHEADAWEMLRYRVRNRFRA